MSVQWHRRAKPLLGTLVEITVLVDDEQHFVHATDAAFARVAQIHHAMSFHDAASDVRALARAAAGALLRPSADTLRVLRHALDIEVASSGVFNVTVAPRLVAAGLLPVPDAAAVPQARSLLQGLEWVGCDQLRVRAPLWVDLGGIAKGYAVDCAVEVLRGCGVPAGLVNAGGDMRAFGAHAHPVHLRFASGLKAVASLRNAALASSCNAHLLAGGAAAHSSSPHVDTRTGRCLRTLTTVVVQAASAMQADALTKVAMVCAATADRLCSSRRAQWREFDFFDAGPMGFQQPGVNASASSVAGL